MNHRRCVVVTPCRRCAVPAFGRMPLDRLGPEDMTAWFDGASRDKPGAANRALEILRAMMFRADEWRLRERGTNPYLGIAKNPREQVARFLDMDELARLGRALDANEAEWPEAVAAIRLLALTGCRRGEVVDLRWGDIGGDVIKLSNSKTGQRAVPLGEAARALIAALPGARDPDAFLFPRHSKGRRLWILPNCWRTICADAGLGRLRLHDLRHTVASQAASWRARICPWWASCLGIVVTVPRRGMPISPTLTLSRP